MQHFLVAKEFVLLYRFPWRRSGLMRMVNALFASTSKDGNMAPRKGESDEGQLEPVAPQPSPTSGKEKVTIQIDRADAERLLQALLGQLVIDKQRLAEVVQKHWTSSHKGRISRVDDTAGKHEPPSR